MKGDLADLLNNARSFRTRREQALVTLRRELKSRKTQRSHWKQVVEAQRIVQAVAKDVQQQVHDRIAALVTKCLAAVYDDPYQFKIRFETRRGKTDARMVFVRNGHERTPAEVGGGVLDLAAFALRLACLVIKKPARRRVLVCDEPFKHLDAVRQDRVKVLLERLSEDLHVQLIFVTHSESLTAGKVVRI